MTATAVTSSGGAICEAAAANGSQFQTSDDTSAFTNVPQAFTSALDDATLTSTIGGAALPVGQVLTLKITYVTD